MLPTHALIIDYRDMDCGKGAVMKLARDAGRVNVVGGPVSTDGRTAAPRHIVPICPA